jgi:hypothetical protein
MRWNIFSAHLWRSWGRALKPGDCAVLHVKKHYEPVGDQAERHPQDVLADKTGKTEQDHPTSQLQERSHRLMDYDINTSTAGSLAAIDTVNIFTRWLRIPFW